MYEPLPLPERQQLASVQYQVKQTLWAKKLKSFEDC